MTPKVSVLIPAFRPTYLGQAIASVLSQGFEDYELLISDDSGGGDVRPVVDRFRDPRIVYSRTSGRVGGTLNVRALWAQAAAPLVKYLFDDDLMLPNALIDLVDQIDRWPDASFVFAHRDIVDQVGRIQSEPRFVEAGKAIPVSHEMLTAKLVPTCANRVGEFSNILINRKIGLSLNDVYAYRGFDIEMLGDVAFFLNASAKGPAIGLGRTIGQFRKHAEQNSSHAFNPLFAKAVCEWELFVRGEYAAGVIDQAQALAGVDRLEHIYGVWIGRLPKLQALNAGLPGLRIRIEAEDRDVLDDEFRRAWSETSLGISGHVAGQ